MKIRRAEITDISRINELLKQVCLVHHEARPDLFRHGGRKYSDVQLEQMLTDGERPILVAADENDEVLGYAFCIFQQHPDHNVLTDVRTLYVDDICVDEQHRGQHIGRALYDAVVSLARENGCYNVTLNVWTCNPAAMKFYEACGMLPQKIGMEMLL